VEHIGHQLTQNNILRTVALSCGSWITTIEYDPPPHPTGVTTFDSGLISSKLGRQRICKDIVDNMTGIPSQTSSMSSAYVAQLASPAFLPDRNNEFRSLRQQPPSVSRRRLAKVMKLSCAPQSCLVASQSMASLPSCYVRF